MPTISAIKKLTRPQRGRASAYRMQPAGLVRVPLWQAAEKQRGPSFDKLTVRSKPLTSLGPILSLPKDEAKNPAFSASC